MASREWHERDWRDRDSRDESPRGREWRTGSRGGARLVPAVPRTPAPGYRRSDERILDDIVERLMMAAVDASEIEVKVENGEVTLSGTVRERRDKRRVEDACEDVFGVQDVHNQIRVVREGEGDPGGVH